MKLKLLKKDLYLDQTLIVTLSGRSYSHKHMPISLLILRPESQIQKLIFQKFWNLFDIACFPFKEIVSGIFKIVASLTKEFLLKTIHFHQDRFTITTLFAFYYFHNSTFLNFLQKIFYIPPLVNFFIFLGQSQNNFRISETVWVNQTVKGKI